MLIYRKEQLTLGDILLDIKFTNQLGNLPKRKERRKIENNTSLQVYLTGNVFFPR